MYTCALWSNYGLLIEFLQSLFCWSVVSGFGNVGKGRADWCGEGGGLCGKTAIESCCHLYNLLSSV